MKSVALVLENDPIQLAFFERGLMDLGLRVISAQSFGKSTSNAIEKDPPSFALLDFDLGPGPTGVDVGAYIRRKYPSVKLVLISSYTDIWQGEDPLVEKIFAETINKRDVTTLEKFKDLISPVLGNSSISRSVAQKNSGFSSTSLRVWRLVALGRTNLEIATELGISVKGVEKHLGQLTAHLGLNQSQGNLRVLLVRKYVERNGQLPSK